MVLSSKKPSNKKGASMAHELEINSAIRFLRGVRTGWSLTTDSPRTTLAGIGSGTTSPFSSNAILSFFLLGVYVSIIQVATDIIRIRMGLCLGKSLPNLQGCSLVGLRSSRLGLG